MPHARARRDQHHHRAVLLRKAPHVARWPAYGGEVDGAFPREAEHDAPIPLLDPIAGFDRPIEDEAAMSRMVANAHADALLGGRRQGGRQKQKQQD
jgi:hypothetical protein